MFFQLRASSAFSTQSNSETSFSSDNSSSISTIAQPTTAIVHQLIARDFDDISSANFHCQRPIQREPFRIPRPLLALPRPLIRVPTNNSLWTSSTRPTRIQPIARSSSPSLITHHTERPLYQNLGLAPPPPPPPARPIPIQYQIGPPPSFPRFVPIPMVRRRKPKRFAREKPPGIFTTLSAGGFQTFAGLIYLCFLLALPIIKLVFGILYINECPVNKNIPLYMILSGAGGLALVLLLLLTSTCTYCRVVINANKFIHRLMICTIGLARGTQGALAIFLFIWFFFGNAWVFSVRYRVRTDKPFDVNNYCHPTLYSFAFYVLIFTYIYAAFTCCLKFCLNFFCCGACDIWQRAFS